MRGRFVWMSEDGSREDVSEGVQALYDLVISSMDWGSGFWSWEDALPVAQIGRLAEFAKIDEVERYVRDLQHNEEPLPHEHVFSAVGRCIWPRCEEWSDHA